MALTLISIELIRADSDLSNTDYKDYSNTICIESVRPLPNLVHVSRYLKDLFFRIRSF